MDTSDDSSSDNEEPSVHGMTFEEYWSLLNGIDAELEDDSEDDEDAFLKAVDSLKAAIKSKNLEEVKKALQNSWLDDPDFEDLNLQQVVLEVIVKDSPIEILECLSRSGFEFLDEFSDGDDSNSLTKAVIDKGNVKLLEFCLNLMSKSSIISILRSVDEPAGFTPFHYAIEVGEVKIVELLAKKYESLKDDVKGFMERKTEEGWTPLALAVSKNNPEIVRFLLSSCNARLHTKSWGGDTALQIALAEDIDDVIPVLCEFGAQDINTRDSQGFTIKDYIKRKPRYAPYLLREVMEQKIANPKERKKRARSTPPAASAAGAAGCKKMARIE